MPGEHQVTERQLAQLLKELVMARAIYEAIAHHTWVPTVAQYRGEPTIRGVRLYHMNVRGWSDNGYHIMIGPDGTIWICRPLRRSGGHCLHHNAHSIGVNVVGNFDRGHDAPMGETQYRTLVRVLAMLCARFELDVEDIFPHSAFAPKTCPGTGVSMGRLRQDVRAAMSNEIAPRPFRVEWAGTYLSADAADLRNGRTWVRAADVAEIEGREIHWRPDDNKVYVK